MILRVLALAAGLAGCDPGPAGVTRADCEAVLAHLLVLGRDVPDPDGFVEECPRVMRRREVRCYQRATTLSAAEACEPAEAGLDGGMGWVRPGDRTAVMLHELRQIRDLACSCTDASCRIDVGDRVDRWMSGFDALQGDRVSTEMAMKLYREIEACRSGARGATPDAGITGGLPSCQEYIRLIERMSECSGLPQSTRDSLQGSLPTLREAYDPTHMSDDVQQQIDASCAQGLPTLRDQLRTLGCP